MKQYFVCLLTSFLLLSSQVTAQRNPSFLGCAFGVNKATAVKYFADNLSGRIIRENPDKDTLSIKVDGYVGELKVSEVSLFFHGDIFWGGHIDFRLDDNSRFENKSELLKAVKQDFLKRYPSFAPFTEPKDYSSYDSIFEGLLGSKETYKSKKWYAAFHNPDLLAMVWMQLHDIELFTRYKASKSNRVSF